MKDFIAKLEQEFDKQLADKTNYGRNQVKEHFLRACVNVLATQESGLVRTPEKIDVLPTNPILVPGPVSFEDNGDCVRVEFTRIVDTESWFLTFKYLNSDKPTVTGETCIDYPELEDLIQLYHFYKDQLPF
jgi:hypothetical protein